MQGYILDMSKKLNRIHSIPGEVTATLRQHGVLTCKVIHVHMHMHAWNPCQPSVLWSTDQLAGFVHSQATELQTPLTVGFLDAELPGAHGPVGPQLPPAAVPHTGGQQGHCTKTKNRKLHNLSRSMYASNLNTVTWPLCICTIDCKSLVRKFVSYICVNYDCIVMAAFYTVCVYELWCRSCQCIETTGRRD